jgi:hypothetical protein
LSSLFGGTSASSVSLARWRRETAPERVAPGGSDRCGGTSIREVLTSAGFGEASSDPASGDSFAARGATGVLPLSVSARRLSAFSAASLSSFSRFFSAPAPAAEVVVVGSGRGFDFRFLKKISGQGIA